MAESEFPKNVEQLILERIDSVAQLEIALLLHENPQRMWSANELAQHMRIDRRMAKAQLDELCGKRLIEWRSDVDQYHYAAATPDLEKAMVDLRQAYTDRRVTVIGMIFSKPADKLRSFADAFRLRKD